VTLRETLDWRPAAEPSSAENGRSAVASGKD
jgi:hypothetical protein